MFYLLTCEIPSSYPEIKKWIWNYHEASHGERAHDSVGGVGKKPAENFVAKKGDIYN